MFRKIIFWSHLIIGVTAGLVIAVVSFTGAALAFEKETIAWAERDVRRIAEPATNAMRLPLTEVLARAHAAQPELRVANLTVSIDPRDAIALGTPRNTTVYANPLTGELREGQAERTRAFMGTMRKWHTRLVATPGPGNWGVALVSAANVAFLLLTVSGLCLWWPRQWQWRTLRPAWWFVRDARGRARDWNWHNVFGFWSLPVLFVLTATGVVLSYSSVNDFVFRLTGDTPPSAVRPAQNATKPKPPALSAASENARAPLVTLSPDALIKVAQTRLPDWETITLRFNSPLRAPASSSTAAEFRSVQPVSVLIVKEKNPWPPFSTVSLNVDNKGDIRGVETFAQSRPGQRARRWIRLLHSGEALGWPGQLVAGISCLAGCVLVWTGISLALRRLVAWRTQ
jgi:uncharacterized iron-regulated membrane protein